MKQEIKERIELINKGIVPAGYKKTPVGICPVEWEENIYRNLGEFAKGKGIPGYALLDNGLPCVGYGDIYTKYNIKFNAAKCFTDEITAKDSKKISKNTLLFTGSGETAEEIGKCVCYCGDEDISAGGDIILFNSYNVNPLFLSYQQNFWPFIKEKARLGQGHSVVHIYPDDISKLHAIFPKTKPEQEKIAEILNCATRQVELQEQIVDKLKVQKKALMQKLLTPQPDWQEVKLGDVVTYASSGGTPKTDFEEYYNGNIVWVSIDDITKCQKYIENSSRKITDLGLKNSSTKLLNPNTILFAMYASIGKCAISKVLCTTSQAILGLVANEKKVGYEYLYYTLCFMEDSLKLLGQKGSQSNLNKQMVLNFNVFLPNLKEQNEITNILKNIDKQIELQQKLLEQYKLRKKALMQLLLTGIVRVC